MILEKVSFGIFSIILVSKEEKNSSVESNDNMLSLSKFSWNLVIVKIIKIRHFEGHICQNNHDLKIILCKNKHYIVVVIVPNFHLTARLSSFFLAFLLQVYGEPY